MSKDPLGLAPATNPVAYVDNPYSWSDPLGLNPYERAIKRTNKIMKNAEAGTVRRAPNYHGRLPADLERDILASPDGVYASTGTGGRFIFHKGQDIVITEGQGAKAGRRDELRPVGSARRERSQHLRWGCLGSRASHHR